MKLKGRYTDAVIYAKTIEDTALEQIQLMIDQPFMADAQVRIMPDVHAGAGCTIGTTFPLNGMVCPNLVGVDIGCGMYVVPIVGDFDLAQVDEIVGTIPSGFNVHNAPIMSVDLSELKCFSYLDNYERLACSMGTLGGGNHFIEIDETDGQYYLVIHTGSRNLGKQVADIYQEIAIFSNGSLVEKDALAYLDGKDYEDYLFDMKIIQHWAILNRMWIAHQLTDVLELDFGGAFHTIHNYIDMSGDEFVLRKGAVSAKDGELLLIPMNMRDGSLLCRGKGNPEWNYSAPHGAGRLMSRGQAKRALNVEDFEQEMEGIYTSSVCEATLDEAPMVYKDMEEIMGLIGDTVEVIAVLKPVYNYKAH